MRNTLNDLNNYLFAQLERLDNEEMDSDQLADEINRAKAITLVSNQVIQNANLVLEAKKLSYDRTEEDFSLPKMIEGQFDD